MCRTFPSHSLPSSPAPGASRSPRHPQGTRECLSPSLSPGMLRSCLYSPRAASRGQGPHLFLLCTQTGLSRPVAGAMMWFNPEEVGVGFNELKFQAGDESQSFLNWNIRGNLPPGNNRTVFIKGSKVSAPGESWIECSKPLRKPPPTHTANPGVERDTAVG